LGNYALCHKLAIPDGLIAAAAIAQDLELYTMNLKNFKYINGLQLIKSKTSSYGKISQIVL
jgi:predicted nucleic acid-binding protein